MIKRFHDGRDWFFEKRFGLFIHWGLYAIPACQEQVLWRYRYPRKDYEKLVGRFNPRRFEPNRWLDALQEAGMEYLCFTTKHHDGFCMWDTRFTDYKVTNSPFGKDVLAMLAEACHSRGVLLGLYYSLPDWHHANYPNLGRHHEMFGPRAGDEPDEDRYLEYVRNQVDELCGNYGSICAFFWDVNVGEFDDPGLNELIRERQPRAVINDRGPAPGDYSTPERHVPEGRVFERPTEACQSMGRESWGYREHEDYYAYKHLMQSLDKTLAMGGNYLLNVGPKADGTFPVECTEGLERIGRWYRAVGEAFRGTVPCSYMLSTSETHLFRYDDVLMTRRGNTFYLHLYRDLQTSALVVDCFDVEPSQAVLLNDDSELACSVDVLPWRWKQKPCLRVRNLPVNTLTDEVMVVKLVFDDSVAE